MLLDEIKSNNTFICARCSLPIVEANFSGWEIVLSDGKTTQPICKWCNMAESLITEKANDDDIRTK